MNGTAPRKLSADAPAAELSLDAQRRMVDALRHEASVRQAGEVALIETHISFVLVGAERAYKIKKALKNPFLDQSTLALRDHACREELRLNTRLAASLYLGVLPITGTPQAPRLGGAGAAIDWAVEMRAFDQAGLWDRLAQRHALQAAQVDQLAHLLVPFHASAAVADARGRLGSPAQVRAPLLDSLDELDRRVQDAADRERLRVLRAWEAETFARLEPAFAARRAAGRIRECHGDLHLGNVTEIDGRTTVFDGIEFNDDFRWIDVMSDVAFMAMDLHAHGLPALAHRFVNAYLEQGGDYDGVRVLNDYRVHRALVRTKVEWLRHAQTQGEDAAPHAAAARRYLELALDFIRAAPPVLMLTHGFSGSGKTTHTQALVEASGAIRIRSDVERKRLAGLRAEQRSGAAPFAGLYGDDITAATYARLLELAAPVLEGGRHAILDATFLRRSQRDEARRWAAARGIACLILAFDADPDELRRRVRERRDRGFDASEADEAVLEAQMRSAEPLGDDERAAVFTGPQGSASAEVQAGWAPLLERLNAAGGAAGPSRGTNP